MTRVSSIHGDAAVALSRVRVTGRGDAYAPMYSTTLSEPGFSARALRMASSKSEGTIPPASIPAE